MESKRYCSVCRIELKVRHKIFFCSNRCQQERAYLSFIELWKQNAVDGSRGVKAKSVSAHVVRFLRRKYSDKCILCGWSGLNLVTGKVPLEIDHIDGDSENNAESNLRLICPNCHSLTSNYKGLNMGKGRKWRKDKYIKNRQ